MVVAVCEAGEGGEREEEGVGRGVVVVVVVVVVGRREEEGVCVERGGVWCVCVGGGGWVGGWGWC